MNKAVTFGLLCVVIISLVPSDAQKCSIKKKQLTKKVCELNGIVSELNGALEEHVKKAEADTASRRNQIDTLVNNLTAVVNALEEKVQEKEPTPDTSCPSGFIHHGSSCYMFSREKQPWTGAMTLCNSIGAHLVEITSQEENKFLSDHAIKRNCIFAIGANDIAKEGEYVWAQSGTKVEFFDWGLGQPNNHLGVQNCLYIHSNKRWNDIVCKYATNFICEKSNVFVG